MSLSPCSNVLEGEDDITALALQSHAVWLGTRSGYVMLLDANVLTEGGDALLGLQFCGEGRVKSIVVVAPRNVVTSQINVS